MTDEIVQKILSRARAKHIIPLVLPVHQLSMTVSAIGELAEAVVKIERDKVKTALGKSIVRLIILAELSGMEVEEAINSYLETGNL
jgi:NTP pyrophosphatase (non-canonical NTP hydrolase)